jgi:putative hemolysin
MIEIVLSVFLCALLLGGLLSSAGASLLSTDPEELKKESAKAGSWAQKAVRMLSEPQVGVIAQGLPAELIFLAGAVFLFWLGPVEGWCLGILLVSYLLGFLFFGELLPESVGRVKAKKWVPVMTWVLWAGSLIMRPWFWLDRAAQGVWKEGLGENTRAGGFSPSMGELAWRLRASHKEEPFLLEERRMINRVLRFSKASVKEVMIPLIDVCMVEEKASVKEAVRLICQEGYSRLPVYRERVDRVVGLLRGMDLLLVENMDDPISAHLREVSFVPEFMPVEELMVKLQREGQHLAVIVDEYGGAVGIVTMEDLLEEIVGEIQDEYDVEEPLLRWISPHQVLVPGRAELDDLNEKLGLALPKEDYETLAGMLLKAFRRIPGQGDSLVLGEIRFTVKRTTDRSVEEVLISLPRPNPGKKESGSIP